MSLIIPGEGHGKSIHGLDDRLIGARLLGWMVRESNGTNWWIVALAHDGKVVSWDSSGQNLLVIPKDRQHFAIRVLSALNADAGEDGLWLVAWFDDCKRFYMLWKDQDGDIQIPIESDISWLRLREWSPHDFVKQAAAAFVTWEKWHENMEYGRAQQIKLANGERPADSAVL